VNAGA
jgi:hypothetical protein